MLTPTHVHVGVLRTKDLIKKGKNGTNDAFIIFGLGKQKFQSSVKEKASDQLLEWNEGCEIQIPLSEGNKSEVVLKVLHKASIGDKFLGRVALPLSEFDVTAKARPKWYPLRPKPGNEKDTKHRGEIEVRISFLVKSVAGNGSSNDLRNKAKQKDGFRSSLGSILSLGKKKKKDKSGYNSSSKESLSSSIDSLRYGSTSSRIHMNNNLPVINDDPGVISEEEDDDDDVPLELKIDETLKSSSVSIRASIPDKLNSSLSSLPTTPKSIHKSGFRDIFEEQDDPKGSTGELSRSPTNTRVHNNTNRSSQLSPKQKKFQLPSVIVEEEPSPSSYTISEALTAPPTPEPAPKLTVSASMSNLMDGSSGKTSVRKTFKSMFSSSKHLSVDDVSNNGGSAKGSSNSVQSQLQMSPGMVKRIPSIRDLKIPKETYKLYEKKSKEELVAMIVYLQSTVDGQKQKIGDLEDYIDKLLLKVLDNMPVLLRNGGSVREPKS